MVSQCFNFILHPVRGPSSTLSLDLLIMLASDLLVIFLEIKIFTVLLKQIRGWFCFSVEFFI